MMTAAEINGGHQTMYGDYVIGQNWFFLTLKDNAYCISEEFVATREDIFRIYGALKKLKSIIDIAIENDMNGVPNAGKH